MQIVKWIVCGLALTAAACGGTAMEQEESAIDEVPMLTRSAAASKATLRPAGETCTDTFGQCLVGRCELGPMDHFQIITETCCDGSGNCTVEKYRLCGC